MVYEQDFAPPFYSLTLAEKITPVINALSTASKTSGSNCLYCDFNTVEY